MKKKIFFMLFTVLMLCCLSGCSNKTVMDNNSEAFAGSTKIYTEFNKKYEGERNKAELDADESTTYLDMGLWKDAKALHDTTIYQKKEDKLDGFISLGNGLKKDCNFTIAVFDNYQQIEVTVDKEKMKQCTVNIKNDEEIEIPFELPALDKGKHNLMVVIFTDTYGELTEEERSVFSDSALQCTIIVDDDTSQTELKQMEIQKIKANSDGIALNKDGETNLLLETGNLSDKNLACAVILIDNYNQVVLADGMDNPYSYIELQPEDGIKLDLSEYLNKIKKDKRHHEISAIRVEKTGTEGESLEADVSFSNRISIN